MTGFREQGSGIPLMLLHGISSGAASWHKQMALNGFRVLAWDMPGYGESPMLAVARANAGITPTRWQPCWIAPVSGRQCWSAIPWGRWWPAPLRQSSLSASSIWCWPTPRRVRQCRAGAAGAGLAQPRAADGAGGDILAQTRAAKLLRPGARAEDIATVASGMRALRPEGYLAAAWMLAHDDIHGWLKRYSGTFEVWCGEQDAITQPELVQGLALRYGMPFIAIPQAGHASYLDNDAFFNQQLLRINEEVRDECTN